MTVMIDYRKKAGQSVIVEKAAVLRTTLVTYVKCSF